MTKSKQSKTVNTTVKKEKSVDPNSNSDSLAFKKITNSSQIQFPNQDIYYIYRPAKADASLFERFAAFLSLLYYKYLLHTGIYVMNKNERRIVNGIVMISVILSSYQLLQLFTILLGY
jgi:hypothetical protein